MLFHRFYTMNKKFLKCIFVNINGIECGGVQTVEYSGVVPLHLIKRYSQCNL